MEKLERRAIGRVEFPSKGFMVICDTQEVIAVDLRDLGPIGVGVCVNADLPNLMGQDVILVAETLIMYADVVRQIKAESGAWTIGLSARKFTREVLQYLFEGIELRNELKESIL